MTDDAASLLGEDGPFAREVPGFAPRQQQTTMASAVEEAIADRQTLIAEAGTGTGKTFAYLVPALMSGRRVIVSTGTKALQDQLFHRDLPRVRSVLGSRLKAALLKGRANYLCLHRMELTHRDGRFTSREQVAQVQTIRAWAKRTLSGDKAELAEIPEDSPLWPQVTSSTENCLGSECPQFADCYVVKARQAAQEADLVVVNHHLLFADLAIRQEGFGEILPGADAFILDEAHQVPELAGQFFSTSVSARQITELVRDSQAECASATGALAALQPLLDPLPLLIQRIRLEIDGLPPRAAFALIEQNVTAMNDLDDLRNQLFGLVEALSKQAERSRGFEALHERASDLVAQLTQLLDSNAHDQVHWYETTPHGFSLNATPLDLAAPLRELRAQTRAAWIYTSATLSVAGHFDHFARQLGLDDPVTLSLQSPFDYSRQALLWMPSGLPEPSAFDYTDRVIDAVLPALAASKGRAFLLFTSHRALRRAAERLAELAAPYPLFVQGSAPRHQLLEDFRQSGNGVLLGAASFWEGVDVVGEALSLVLIDKLPFAAPDDPVLEARLKMLREEGRNPFVEWQVPNAVIALKQGSGRLIRDIHDRGVLVLCDPRLLSKPYGRLFLASLPAMPRAEDVDDVQAFFDGPLPGSSLFASEIAQVESGRS